MKKEDDAGRDVSVCECVCVCKTVAVVRGGGGESGFRRPIRERQVPRLGQLRPRLPLVSMETTLE